MAQQNQKLNFILARGGFRIGMGEGCKRLLPKSDQKCHFDLFFFPATENQFSRPIKSRQKFPKLLEPPPPPPPLT